MVEEQINEAATPPKSMRDIIREAYKESVGKETPAAARAKEDEIRQAEAGTSESVATEVRKARDEQGRFQKQETVDKVPPPADTGSVKTEEAPEATTSEPAPAATTALSAPSSWSKEKHAEWSKIPESAQKYITQREKEMQEGVARLKRDYEEVDAAISPYKAIIRQYNQTPGQTVKQLFDWNMALAGPNKVDVARQLLQRFQIDVSKLVPQAPSGNSQTPSAQAIPEQIQPYLQDLMTRQGQIEARLEAERQAMRQREVQQAETDILTWSADKPHFENVRGIMANLAANEEMAVRNGTPTLGLYRPNGTIDLDKAYAYACKLDPNVSVTFEADEKAKREATIAAQAAKLAKEAIAKADKERQEAAQAKKAGASLSPGSAAGAGTRPSNPVPRGESVRDSLKRAMSEARKGS